MSITRAAILLLVLSMPLGAERGSYVEIEPVSILFHPEQGHFQLAVSSAKDDDGRPMVEALVSPDLGVDSALKLLPGDVLDCVVKNSKIMCRELN